MPSGDNNRKLSLGQVDELVRRYTTPLPDGTWEGAKLLAREFGVTHGTVYRWLELRGVGRRSARESHAGGKRCKPVKNLPQGDAPGCKCSCGQPVEWNQRKNRWNRYLAGHQHPDDAPYKDPGWLRGEYVGRNLSAPEIAAACGVTKPTILAYLNQFGIERRNASEAHSGRMLGEANPAWKGGVAAWPYSSDWKVLARKIRERDKWTCQDCGERRVRWGVHLHVHHIDGNKLNNDPSNLIALCARCHNDRHRRERLGPVERTPRTWAGRSQ